LCADAAHQTTAARNRLPLNGGLAILGCVVTYEREISQWRGANPVLRALMIRDDADRAWLACQLQHERMMTPAPDPSNPTSSADLVRQAIDLDFFFVVVNRLAAVAGLAAKVSDPTKVLSEAIARFNEGTEDGRSPTRSGTSMRLLLAYAMHWNTLPIFPSEAASA
jgi:hypothetical protein